MEPKLIVKLEYEKSYFHIEKMQIEISDNLTIEYKDNGDRLITYNQKQVNVDDNALDELVDKVISITDNQGIINEYIDDCGATLKITFHDNSIEEYDRGFSDGQTDIGTLFDEFIYKNIEIDTGA